MTFLSNSQRLNNEVNTPVEKYLTKEEIITLYEYLKHEFIIYENDSLYKLMGKITAIANDKLGPKNC